MYKYLSKQQDDKNPTKNIGKIFKQSLNRKTLMNGGKAHEKSLRHSK